MTRNPDPKTSAGEITRLLHAWHEGDEEAHEALWPIVYDELRRLAGTVLRGRDRVGRQGRTSLVHKAYLRLLGSDVELSDRRHFFAVAARAMRFVLVDEARRQLADKRGAGAVLSLDDEVAESTVEAEPLGRRADEVLAVHQALGRLARIQPRHEKLVELRYFAGFSVDEAAEVLEVTPRTLSRDWKAARTWLRGVLEETASDRAS
ncbi:MAG: ECF-type sigma factor [Acidobacteriota bacterium]